MLVLNLAKQKKQWFEVGEGEWGANLFQWDERQEQPFAHPFLDKYFTMDIIQFIYSV